MPSYRYVIKQIKHGNVIKADNGCGLEKNFTQWQGNDKTKIISYLGTRDSDHKLKTYKYQFEDTEKYFLNNFS